jgi:hypothetical protein
MAGIVLIPPSLIYNLISTTFLSRKFHCHSLMKVIPPYAQTHLKYQLLK